MRNKIKYQENVGKYNANPNICKHCGAPILVENGHKLSEIQNKKFCDSSCAASYNNKGKVKNKNGNNGKTKRNVCSSYLDNYSDAEIIEVYNNAISILDFCQKLGYKSYISKRNKKTIARLNSIGIDLLKLNKNQNYILNKRTCSKCGRHIYKKNQSGLCHICYRERYNNEKIQKWLSTGDTGYVIGANITGGIRRYIYDSQNNKCAICGIDNFWNAKDLKFVLDHIDGDAANNKRENLRLICPNCDSQLDTYKSKNKNSARKFRHKYYDTHKDLEINGAHIKELVSFV